MRHHGFSGDSRTPARHWRRQKNVVRSHASHPAWPQRKATKRRARGATRALLIVPPFVKSSSGPALGPAMLRGAAAAAGHRVDFLDLAIETVRALVASEELNAPTGLAGDHDKNESALRDAQTLATRLGALPELALTALGLFGLLAAAVVARRQA